MKEDRFVILIGILAVVAALMAFTTGSTILAGIMLMIALAIFMNRRGKSPNDRSIYEKVIRTDLSIGEIREKLKETETALGKAWIAEYRDSEGDVIVFGPDRYRDAVIISRKGRDVGIRHIVKPENIIRKSEDEQRFADMITESEIEITPLKYSVYAAFRLASVMLVKQLFEYIGRLDRDRDAAPPESFGLFRFYYHNSTEGFFRDAEANDIMKVENCYSPFTARVLDTDGNELASVKPHEINSKGEVVDSAGYELFANGEHFGEIRKHEKEEAFIAETEDGIFTVTVFPACHRAKVSCNYTVVRDGETKAVIAGSPNLLFDTVGRSQNDIILSYDDNYLVLYAVLEVFIMTLYGRFLK